jgi:hypothetical protein
VKVERVFPRISKDIRCLLDCSRTVMFGIRAWVRVAMEVCGFVLELPENLETSSDVGCVRDRRSRS